MFVIKCRETRPEHIAFNGQYLLALDVDARDGRGQADWTADLASALKFETPREAMDTWRRQSNAAPLRDDGKPNRPLSAFTVEIVSEEEAPRSFTEREALKAARIALSGGAMDAMLVDTELGVAQVETVEELERWFAERRVIEARALANTTPRQHAIGWGEHFARMYVHEDKPLLIFGRIPTEEEFWEKEGTDPDERAWQEKRLADSWPRGYRYGWCYSTVVPDGEPGDTHVSTMWTISADEFEQARERKWDPKVLLTDPATREWMVEVVAGRRT